MLNPMQQVMLTVLMGPEDPTAFKKFQAHCRTKKWRKSHLEKSRERRRELWHLNHEKNIAYKRAWKEKNREKLKIERQERYWRDPEKSRASNRVHARKNWETQKPKQRVYAKNKYNADPNFRFAALVRTRIRRALSRSRTYKTNTTVFLIGCTFPELRAHLEKQFRPGMTWENHGTVWHIDHIRPCASFDLTDTDQQKICFNYANLQPLFAEENFKKGAK